MKEKKARVETAMHATKAARRGGIVPGGRIALCAPSRPWRTQGENEDIQTGINIVRRALEEPIRQSPSMPATRVSIIVQQAQGEGQGVSGFRRYSGKWVDMFEAGSSTRPR